MVITLSRQQADAAYQVPGMSQRGGINPTHFIYRLPKKKKKKKKVTLLIVAQDNCSICILTPIMCTVVGWTEFDGNCVGLSSIGVGGGWTKLTSYCLELV